MIFRGQVINLFEDDLKDKDKIIMREEEITNSLCNYYCIILSDFEKRKYPPIEENFIERFKTDYRVELSLEEFVELKDYAENYYSGEVTNNIIEGFENGSIKKLY